MFPLNRLTKCRGGLKVTEPSLVRRSVTRHGALPGHTHSLPLTNIFVDLHLEDRLRELLDDLPFRRRYRRDRQPIAATQDYHVAEPGRCAHHRQRDERS